MNLEKFKRVHASDPPDRKLGLMLDLAELMRMYIIQDANSKSRSDHAHWLHQYHEVMDAMLWIYRELLSILRQKEGDRK